MKLRKVLSGVLASAMVLGLVGVNAAAEEGANKLTVWCWDPAFNINAMNVAAEIYKVDHPDFELEVVENSWDDIQVAVTTAATSGDYSTMPDVFLMQDNAFQKNVINYPDLFVDLTDSGIDFSQFAAAKAAYSTVDGKNYGVPFDNGTAIACYRTDVLEQAGYTVADFTDIGWADFIEKGKAVLEATGTPLLSCVAGDVDTLMLMIQSAGGSLFDENGNPAIVDNEIVTNVLETYGQLVKEGILVEVNNWDEYVQTLNSGSVAGTINGCWIMASIQVAEDQSGKWAVTNVPALDGIDTATNYSNNGGSSWAVTTNCANPELAEDFFANTFAGSVELYEKILPSGALATYLPAGDSEAYAQESDFFGGEAVYALLTTYADATPSNNTGVYYYEARDAIATAKTNYVNGADLASELQVAQDTVNFAMGN